MSGNFDARRKVRELMSGNFDTRRKFREFLQNKEDQGKVREFCFVKSIFNQSEHPNFENFLGEHATRLP